MKRRRKLNRAQRRTLERAQQLDRLLAQVRTAAFKAGMAEAFRAYEPDCSGPMSELVTELGRRLVPFRIRTSMSRDPSRNAQMLRLDFVGAGRRYCSGASLTLYALEAAVNPEQIVCSEFEHAAIELVRHVVRDG